MTPTKRALQSAKMKVRTDIQALRGLAVFWVVLHHAHLIPLGAGYLGVDVFFVISGYLITGLVARGAESGTFGFVQFYFRRAKRLLPAAYATLLATVVFSYLALDRQELDKFAYQLVGALTFTGNVVLLGQSDYFGGDAGNKPLLHFWSLAIEEQYYLLLPFALVATSKRYWLGAAWAVTLASLVLCLVSVNLKPVAAFYLLPTRAWELGIGSLGALISQHAGRRLVGYLLWPAIAALVVLPIAPLGTPHPGLDAILICLATIVVIRRNDAWIQSSAPVRWLAGLGNWSYSLYLVHWPIFAFLNNAQMGPSRWLNVAALSLAAGLGYLLYRFVELPARQARIQPSRSTLAKTVAATLSMGALPFAIAYMGNDTVDYAFVRRNNLGFGPSCDFKGVFSAPSECSDSADPRILVWGDSFAMHLVPAIAASSKDGIIQATKSACGPFIGIAPVYRPYTEAWGKECIEFNDSVLEYLARTSVNVVVLSSPFGVYLEPSYRAVARVLIKETGGTIVAQQPSVEAALAAMRETVDQIRSKGKRVVVVAPPPSTGTDFGRCLERKATGKLLLGPDRECAIDFVRYQRAEQPLREFLRRLPAEVGVDVIDFDAFLCTEHGCVTSIDNTFVYRDQGHFSYAGARLVGERMNLGSLVAGRAK